ncbi:MAG: 16S rRNA (guanine(527)-N(7))-methyltransferase RsmG [Lachnospiraceae bacterium]|nr:16S rRNA (guanine(527)-N(7))-methyltransferase RsmG [Lachnospiraceae bacterium]
MVLDYNEKVNLTAITEKEDFLQKHFLDSLALIADRNVSRETFWGKSRKKIVSRETIGDDCGDENVARETVSENYDKDNVSRETLKDAVTDISDEKSDGKNVSRETNDESVASVKISDESNDKKNVSCETSEITADPKNVSRETWIRPGAKVIDIGTGAGFPGIPLAIFREDIRVTLLDSLNKRVFFLENTVKTLGLKKCEAIHARAEDLAHQEKYRESYDVCVSRAVAALPVLCEYCLPYVRKGGYFVSYKAAGAEEEVRSAEKAIKVLGGKLHAIDTVVLPGTDIERKLIVIKKVETTPKKYPRKAGTPSKSPL